LDRAEAERACQRLSREHPDRASHTWIAREQSPGDWSVAKIRLPAGVKRDPLRATIEAKPRPPQSDDAPLWRSSNVPPYVGGT
jgi:hypothetical protein